MICTTPMPVRLGLVLERAIQSYEEMELYVKNILFASHVQFAMPVFSLISVSREGIWTVQKVVLEHNHYLAIPNKREKLRSQRSVQEADRKLIGEIRKAGMQPAQVYEFMKEFYGGADKVPFSRMDCNNEIGRERKKYLESNDAQTLIEYLKRKQSEDPTFFYAMQIGKETGQIANFFGHMVSL